MSLTRFPALRNGSRRTFTGLDSREPVENTQKRRSAQRRGRHIQAPSALQKRPLALKLGAARQVSGFLMVSTVLSGIMHKMNTNNYALTETQITPPPKLNPRWKKKTRYPEQLPASHLHQLGELVKVPRRKLPKTSRCPLPTKVAPRQHEKKVTRVHPKVHIFKTHHYRQTFLIE